MQGPTPEFSPAVSFLPACNKGCCTVRGIERTLDQAGASKRAFRAREYESSLKMRLANDVRTDTWMRHGAGKVSWRRDELVAGPVFHLD